MINNHKLVEELNSICESTLVSHLGIEFTGVGEGKVLATMPVDQRTFQPQKLLHGGATMALAETVGSAGSYMLVDREKFYVVGLEINGNHISSATSGFVTATAQILHQGKKTHVWDIRINDESGKLISVCRITNMVVEIKTGKEK